MLSGLAILSGVLVITRKNPVHSALALILTLLCLAGLYLMLYAPFVAGVQIILYVGGIMVLFLFVIMLVNLERSQREKTFNQQWIAGVAAAVVLGALFMSIYVKGKALFAQPVVPFPEAENTQRVGHAVNLNLVAFSRIWGLHGQVFAIFVITDAAAEAAVGLGILIAFFRNKETVNVDEVDLLKW